MSNENEPAFASTSTKHVPYGGSYQSSTPGLTKLEELAARNMAALLSNPRSVGENGDVNAAALAGGAITAAKELLKQLDQRKTE